MIKIRGSSCTFFGIVYPYLLYFLSFSHLPRFLCFLLSVWLCEQMSSRDLPFARYSCIPRYAQNSGNWLCRETRSSFFRPSPQVGVVSDLRRLVAGVFPVLINRDRKSTDALLVCYIQFNGKAKRYIFSLSCHQNASILKKNCWIIGVETLLYLLILFNLMENSE